MSAMDVRRKTQTTVASGGNGHRPRALRGLAILLGVGISAPAWADWFGFEAGIALPGSPSFANALAVGDINGDGRDDVMVAGHGNSFSTYLQMADGRLASPQVQQLPVVSITRMKVVDLDRDGHGELLVGHPGGLAVYSRLVGWRYRWGPECAHFDTGDINLDGWTDVACHGWNANATFYLNEGAGGLAPPVYMQTPAVGAEGSRKQVQLEDVTGDGLPDLVLFSSDAPGFYIHHHDGISGFLPAFGYAHAGPYPAPSGIEVIDMDNDGVAEIVTASICTSSCAALHIHRRDAHGHFRHAQDLRGAGTASGLLAYDIDRDGTRDLLVQHPGSAGSIGRYMGSATRGLSGNEVRSPAALSLGEDVMYAPGDVNGDGCTDMVFNTVVGAMVMRGYCRVRAGSDFDGDGASDIFWRNMATGENQLWRSGHPQGSPGVAATSDLRWRAVGHGDIDGDRKSDLVWRHDTTGANAIWLSANHRTQRETARLPLEWKVAGVADFDGDDLADVLWRNTSNGQNMLWKAGWYFDTQALVAVTDLRWQVAAIGDFDGDARSDILWRHATTGQAAIWNGGNHAERRSITAVTDLRWQVAGAGDVDGDGRTDLVWRHAASGRNAIWRSADHASQIGVTGVTNLDWQLFAVADYDDDDRADLLWRNVRTGANAIWRGANHATQAQVPALRATTWTVPGR